jgi:hypothetical protein
LSCITTAVPRGWRTFDCSLYHLACPNQDPTLRSAFLFGLSEIQTSRCSVRDALIGRFCADGPNCFRSWMKAATHSDLVQNLCASITRKDTWLHRTVAQTRSRSRYGFIRLSRAKKMKSTSSHKSASCSICFTGSLSIAHDSLNKLHDVSPACLARNVT